MVKYLNNPLTPILIILLYLLSLFLPAMSNGKEVEPYIMGYTILGEGAMAIMFFEPRWYVNLIFYWVIFRIICRRNFMFPRFLGWIFLITSLSVFLFRSPWFINQITYTYGAYIWALCMLYCSVFLFCKNGIGLKVPNKPLKRDS